MAMTNTFATFIRQRQEDGSYIIVYPINTSDEVYVDINAKLTLTSKINTMDAALTSSRASIIEDMLSMLAAISPMIKTPLLLNHAYVDDFSNESSTSINGTKGIRIPGKIII